jgi:hypothetical protein
MNDQIEKARAVKDRALLRRDSGDADGALKLINKAVAILEHLWKDRGEAIDKAAEDASPDERALVDLLAETYGVKGGILRSLKEFGEAVRAYDSGHEFERHDARKVDNSYNLVQRLTNRVLAEPGKAGAPRWDVLSKDVWRELESARDELDRQRKDGGRGNDPWAAADVITVQLLLAPKEPDGAQKVEKAYSKFEGLKPNPGVRVYESTLRALGDLKESLEQVDEGERSGNLKTILGQLDSITARLEEGLHKAKTR